MLDRGGLQSDIEGEGEDRRVGENYVFCDATLMRRVWVMSIDFGVVLTAL